MPKARAKRDIGRTFVHSGMCSVSHFEQNVKRNQDFYNYIVPKNCTLTDIYLHVSTKTNLEDLVMQMHVYSAKYNATYEYLIKGTGIVNFKDDPPVKIAAGDRLRFDIADIDSMYEHVTGVGISFMLNYRV